MDNFFSLFPSLSRHYKHIQCTWWNCKTLVLISGEKRETHEMWQMKFIQRCHTCTLHIINDFPIKCFTFICEFFVHAIFHWFLHTTYLQEYAHTSESHPFYESTLSISNYIVCAYTVYACVCIANLWRNQNVRHRITKLTNKIFQLHSILIRKKNLIHTENTVSCMLSHTKKECERTSHCKKKKKYQITLKRTNTSPRPKKVCIR